MWWRACDGRGSRAGGSDDQAGRCGGRVTFRAAQQNVNKLVASGLLREANSKRRNRVYCADAILRLLDAPLAEESTL